MEKTMTHCACTRLSLLLAAALITALASAGLVGASEALNVVNVNAPAINCVFNPACKVTVTDSIGDIPLPGTTAKGRLQSRTYAAARGAPAAGKTAYVYRVNLSNAAGVAPRACVASLWVFTGYPAPQQYNGAGPLDHVFVVTSGGLGSIGVASAVQEGEGTKFTFTRPVCSGSRGRPGDSSFFFGVASSYPPVSRTAYVHTKSGGAPKLTTVHVPVRSPDYTR
jgi:hypothetical protein